MKESANLRRSAIQWLLLATIFWGLSFPTMRALSILQQQQSPNMGSWTFTAWVVFARFSFAAALLFLFTWKSVLKSRRLEIIQGFGLGVFGTAGIALQMDSLYYTDASVAAFLTQSYCVWIPLYKLIQERRAPSKVLVLSTLLVIVGIGILANVDFSKMKLGRGEIENIVASLFFTVQILLLEMPKFSKLRSHVSSFWMFIFMGISALPFAIAWSSPASEGWNLLQNSSVITLVLTLTLFCTLAPFLLMNHWQKFVAAAEAGLIYCIEPIFASMFAIFIPGLFSSYFQIQYPNESITGELLVGGTLITVANFVLQSSERRKRKLSKLSA